MGKTTSNTTSRQETRLQLSKCKRNMMHTDSQRRQGLQRVKTSTARACLDSRFAEAFIYLVASAAVAARGKLTRKLVPLNRVESISSLA